MMIKSILVGSAFALLLSGCTDVSPWPGSGVEPAAPAPPKIGDLDNLRVGPEPVASPDNVEIALHDPKKENRGIKRIRRDALLEAAQGYGSQMGYARRGWEIENLLQRRSLQLDQVFDFSRVVAEAPVQAGYVLPPVVSRSFNAFEGDAKGREASVADEYLTIIAPGEIRPVQPTWRDYLLFAPKPPEEPARSLFPGNEAERKLFRKWFRDGWAAGVELADAEIGSRLDRLRRNYEGMLQYRRLVSMGMMERMVLQDADFNVTGGGTEMRIGSRTVQIVSDAEFETNPQRWSVQLVSERDSLIVATGKIPPISLSDDFK